MTLRWKRKKEKTRIRPILIGAQAVAGAEVGAALGEEAEVVFGAGVGVEVAAAAMEEDEAGVVDAAGSRRSHPLPSSAHQAFHPEGQVLWS